MDYAEWLFLREGEKEIDKAIERDGKHPPTTRFTAFLWGIKAGVILFPFLHAAFFYFLTK